MKHEVVDTAAAIVHQEMLQCRNDVLDAFSDLEAQICVLLRAAKHSVNAPHFGAKVEAFRKIEGISQIAKANYARRDALVDEITSLLPVRADIVHSRMQVSVSDGIGEAVFTNSQNRSEPYPLCRIINVNQMRNITATVLRICRDLKGLGRPINPASSTPPPSPDAAGGP